MISGTCKMVTASKIHPVSQRPASSWDRTSLIMAGIFIYILFDVVVSIVYGATDSFEMRSQALVSDGSEGNRLRQLGYGVMIITSLAIFVMYKKTNILDLIFAVPLTYTLAIIWALMSSSWAIEPSISIRRSLLMYAILLPLSTTILYLGTQRVLQLLYLFLAVVLIASFISVALNPISIFSFSVHPSNEMDPAVAGAWRGVLSHKNSAGPVMVHASIVFLHHAINRSRKMDWVFFLLSVIFIIGSKSKTALALFLLALMIGLVYRFFVVRQKIILFNLCNAFLLGVVFIFSIGMMDEITSFFSIDENLTGRVGIWRSMVPYIQEHLWLGSGYGSFWGIGDASPIMIYAVQPYIMRLGTSHNGYIEILATTGVIGLVITVFALVVVPYWRFTRASPKSAAVNAMFFSMWVFGIWQNFSESQIFSPEKQSWIFVVVAIVTIYHSQRRRTATVRQPAENRLHYPLLADEQRRV